jgi:hypothetical protein
MLKASRLDTHHVSKEYGTPEICDYAHTSVGLGRRLATASVRRSGKLHKIESQEGYLNFLVRSAVLF